MSDQDMEQVRATIHELVERTKAEPDFRDQILSDPEETLTTAGLPKAFIPAFLQEAELSEVSGFILDFF